MGQPLSNDRQIMEGELAADYTDVWISARDSKSDIYDQRNRIFKYDTKKSD